jgi:hypothetical protein
MYVCKLFLSGNLSSTYVLEDKHLILAEMEFRQIDPRSKSYDHELQHQRYNNLHQNYLHRAFKKCRKALHTLLQRWHSSYKFRSRRIGSGALIFCYPSAKSRTAVRSSAARRCGCRLCANRSSATGSTDLSRKMAGNVEKGGKYKKWREKNKGN